MSFMGQNKVRLTRDFEQFVASESIPRLIFSHLMIICCVIFLIVIISAPRERSPNGQQQLAENDSGEAGKGGYSARIFSGSC